MITVGLVKELQFISQVLKTPVSLSIKCDKIKTNLYIEISNGILQVWYADRKIWNESIKDDLSMFGVESCDAIAKIIFSIDSDLDNWRELLYFDNEKG